MTITLAGMEDLNFLLRYVAGLDFPEADEDALWRCGQAWARAAADLRALGPDALSAGREVLACIDGETGAAFAAVWRVLAADPEGFLERLAAACDQLAAGCDTVAVEVEYAKIQYIGALAILGATIAALVGSVWLGGVSAAGIPVAVAAAQATIRLILTRLLTTVVLGAGFNVAIDAVAQVYQTRIGHRDEWDWTKTQRAAEDGAIFGAIGGGVFLAGGRLVPGLAQSLPGLAGGAALTGALGGVAAPLAHGEVPTGQDILLATSAGLLGGMGPDLARGRVPGVDPPALDPAVLGGGGLGPGGLGPGGLGPGGLGPGPESGTVGHALPAGYAPEGYAPEGYAPAGYAPEGYAPGGPEPAPRAPSASPEPGSPVLSRASDPAGDSGSLADATSSLATHQHRAAERPELVGTVVTEASAVRAPLLDTGPADPGPARAAAGAPLARTEPVPVNPALVAGRVGPPVAGVTALSGGPGAVPGGQAGTPPVGPGPAPGGVTAPGLPAVPRLSHAPTGAPPTAALPGAAAPPGAPAAAGPGVTVGLEPVAGAGAAGAATAGSAVAGNVSSALAPAVHPQGAAGAAVAADVPSPLASLEVRTDAPGMPDPLDPTGLLWARGYGELPDAQAVELVRGSAFDTDAGLAFYPDGDDVGEFAAAVLASEGYLTLDLHGSRLGFFVDDYLISPEQFAAGLRTLISDGTLILPEGHGIKLLSCDTAIGGADSPAARLSRELGVEVIAPDLPVWTTLDGEEVVASAALLDGNLMPVDPPDGQWHRFRPDGFFEPIDPVGPAAAVPGDGAAPTDRARTEYMPRGPDEGTDTTRDDGTHALTRLGMEPGRPPALTWSDVADLLPSDDSGYRLTPRDCELLGISPEQVEWWAHRRAPLGMTPQQYEHFRAGVFDALASDGVTPRQVDVRLQGSSAHFFAGEHKTLPRDVAAYESATSAKSEWSGREATERPLRRPFDAMFRLGLESEPSDIDVQLSSDTMLERARAVRDQRFPGQSVLDTRYGFITKSVADEAFPAVTEWAEAQSALVGRKVAAAVFPGEGPPKKPLGPSAHYKDTDWLVEPPGPAEE